MYQLQNSLKQQKVWKKAALFHDWSSEREEETDISFVIFSYARKKTLQMFQVLQPMWNKQQNLRKVSCQGVSLYALSPVLVHNC